jgi:hypothetical protein
MTASFNVSGIDLVQTQIRVAEGHSLASLGLTQVRNRRKYYCKNNYLKGQCHEIVAEVRPQSTRIGLN